MMILKNRKKIVGGLLGYFCGFPRSCAGFPHITALNAESSLLMHTNDPTSREGLTKHIRCPDVDNVRSFAGIRWEFRLPDVR